MQKTRKQTHLFLTTKSCRARILLVGCLLGGGTCRYLGAQAVDVAGWSSGIDHSLESVLVFQSQSSKEAEANVYIYGDILAQQIAGINVAAPGGNAAQPPGASNANGVVTVVPSLDQEADTLIVNPLQAGEKTLISAAGSDIDFMLMTQIFVTVKPKAYRIASGVTGSDNLESLAFRNPDGTYVLFTVNHSTSPVSLEVFWKNRVLTYTQAGNSIALFTWDPKSPLVSLIPNTPQLSAKGFVSVQAICSNVSPLGIDLQCESKTYSCSVFPIRFNCNLQKENVILNVMVYSTDKNATDRMKPGFVTITADPDVGEPTTLRVSCCSAGR